MTSRYPIPQPNSNLRIQQAREVLDPNEDVETGNDDFIFGSYVEWPDLESVDDEQLDELLAIWDINFSSEDVNGYISDVVEDATAADISRAIFRGVAVKRLRENNFPEGIVYEADMDDEYPVDMKYWDYQNYLDSEEAEFEYLYTHPMSYIEYKSQLNKLMEEFEKSNSDLVKSGLIFQLLASAEYYEKSTILNIWENKKSKIAEVFDTDQFVKIALKQLYSAKNRSKAYKLLTGKKLPPLPSNLQDLRNSLAHAPSNSKLCNVEGVLHITYSNSRDNKTRSSIAISDIINALLNHKLDE